MQRPRTLTRQTGIGDRRQLTTCRTIVNTNKGVRSSALWFVNSVLNCISEAANMVVGVCTVVPQVMASIQ